MNVAEAMSVAEALASLTRVADGYYTLDVGNLRYTFVYGTAYRNNVPNTGWGWYVYTKPIGFTVARNRKEFATLEQCIKAAMQSHRRRCLSGTS